ncbi:MAG: filamentous hemagglutinin N-terminal domain-containing protein [Burkholderiales bacterium]|nr:filamentous hemagglutinin N-terminal domain-containing protein [Burkholderiales bacterium]
MAVSPVLANPSGAQVVNGQVSFQNHGNTLTVTNTPGSIINWQNFSIGKGETTTFVQQSTNSAVLNRVTSQDPTQIFGTLASNGRVYLINPNGIVFGRDSQIDVAGLAASSLNITDQDFLAGKRNFTGTGQAGIVSNQGTITTPSGGQVFLIAPNVENHGLIASPQGEVLLAAGHQVQLVDAADPNLQVTVSAPTDSALNLGKIVAQSGRIGIFGALVNQNGVVNADSAAMGENGTIVLKASQGVALGSASQTAAVGAGSGGRIDVFGPQVIVNGGAQVDASGQSGGGTIRIGGDFHGANTAVPNAVNTYVGNGAFIKANAIQTGNGGRVAVWADQQTAMYGHIFAQGGVQGGDGGFVETSGKQYLDFRGLVDLRAPKGTAGTLLLDPTDINITSAPTTPDITPVTSLVGGALTTTNTGSNATSNLSTTDLVNQLNLGNVVVSTSSGAAAPSGGTITVGSAVSGWTASTSLTLSATKDININAPITGPNGTLILNTVPGSGGNISQTAPITVAGLAFNADGQVTLTTAGNSVANLAGVAKGNLAFIDTVPLSLAPVGGLSGLSVTGGSGTSLSVTTTGGALNANEDVQCGNAACAVQLIANTDINLMAGALTATSGATLNAGRNVTQSNGASLNMPTLAVTATNGSVSLGSNTNAYAATVSGSAATGFSMVDQGNILVGGTLSTTSGLVSLQSTGGSVVAGNPVNAPNVALQAANGVAISSPINVTPGTGTIALETTGGNITQTYPITAGSLSAVSTNGNVILNYNGNAVGTVAGSGSGADGVAAFNFVNGASVTVGNVAAVGGVPAISGVTSATGGAGNDIQLKTVGGDITLAAQVLAYSGTSINTAGNIVQGTGGLLSGPAVTLQTAGTSGIGASNAPILTHTGTLAMTSTTDAYVSNGATSLNLANSSINGHVEVDSVGPISMSGSAALSAGSVTLVSQGALSIGSTSPITATAGAIALYSGYTPVPGGTPTVSTAAAAAVPGNLGATTTVDIYAGGTISQTGTSTPHATLHANQYVPPPTLNQCVANPGLAGCASVLPSLTACEANPATFGCSVVLPTIAACTASPATPGCTVVLPTLAACTAAPATAGCSAVLPSLASCTASPATTGCSAVLPTLAACTASPATAGCSAVLPTLASCVASPATAGCSAVLPSLTTCTAAPSTAGCSTVLPTLAACVAAPATAGCAAVLPSLASCVASPSTVGCSVVLPPIAACVSSPSQTGCGVVLPSLASCVASPSAAGCSVVLPTLASCVASPATVGCTVVLPPLNTCVAAPSTAGCVAILPSFAQCTAAPATAGCVAVLPTIAQCAAAPATAGCSVVLPTFSACTLNPSQPGCGVVLTSLIEAPGNTITPPTVSQTVTETDANVCAVGGSASQCTQASTPSAASRLASTTQSTTEATHDKPVAAQKCN